MGASPLSVKTDCFGLMLDALKAALPVGFNQSRILYPNAPFTAPVAPTVTPSTQAQQLAVAWLEVTMQDAGVVPQSPCRQVTSGILSIDIYWPKMTGNTNANSLATTIQKALANEWLGALKINNGLISEFDAKAWYNLNVSFTYQYEESVK